jgi:hypothetical protein
MQLVQTLVFAVVGALVAVTTVLKARSNKQEKATSERRDTGPIPVLVPPLSKSDVKEIIDGRLKEVLPPLLKENMPCYRNEKDCSQKVVTALKEKIDKTTTTVLDNQRRIYDIQKQVGGGRDRPTYPALDQEQR